MLEYLENHGPLFYALGSISQPIFTTDGTRTASVRLEPDGSITFLINRKFWKRLNQTDREFTIAHEGLHVLLRHLLRISGFADREAANWAADLVVNHALIDEYSFVRSDLSIGDKLCFTDTVFGKQAAKIPTDESMEYYYTLLKRKQIKVAFQFDEHGRLKPKVFERMLQRLEREIDALSDEEKRQIQRQLEDLQRRFDNRPLPADEQRLRGENSRGTERGDVILRVDVQPERKRKWETVIQRNMLKLLPKERQFWIRSRRQVLLPDEFLLPSTWAVEERSVDKIEVFFFLDTSGSCLKYAERAFLAFRPTCTRSRIIICVTLAVRALIVLSSSCNRKSAETADGTLRECLL
jgi:hypothetical protein